MNIKDIIEDTVNKIYDTFEISKDTIFDLNQFIKYTTQQAYDKSTQTYNIQQISNHFMVPKQVVINKGKILRIFK